MGSTTVGRLAHELRTTREQILTWGKMFGTKNESIVGDDVPRCIEDLIRRQHLKETHPEVEDLLMSVRPSKDEYYRWIGWVYHKIKERGE